MSDDLVKRLQANGDVLRHIEAQAAEIAARDVRIAKLEALVKEAFGEGFEMGKEDGKGLGEFLAGGGDARRYETFGLLEHWQSSNSRAALGGKDE